MLEALGLSPAASAVYRAMLDRPADGVARLARACGVTAGEVHDALDELARLMLVRASSEHDGMMRAVSPEVGLAGILAREEARLAALHAQLAVSRAGVARLVAERAAAPQTAGGERLMGMDAVQDRLEQLGRTAAREVLGVHPGATQRLRDLDAGRGPNADAVARGVVIKSLYQNSTRNDPHTTEYAQWLLGLGSEVRTAPLLPQRMVIFDRAQALVPVDPADSRKGALHITEPGIVQALTDLFDHTWGTAVPLGATRTADPGTGLTGTERELLRLLGTGLTDETAGQRLGLSSRTVSRHMSSIMERLDASSRFEAGIKAAQRGWL